MRMDLVPNENCYLLTLIISTPLVIVNNLFFVRLFIFYIIVIIIYMFL